MLIATMLMACCTASAMEFYSPEKIGDYGYKLSATGLIGRASGNLKEVGKYTWLFGDLKKGVVIGNNSASKFKSLRPRQIPNSADVYRINSSNSGFTAYVIGGNSHGGIELTLVANNGGQVVTYVDINNSSRYVLNKYGEMPATVCTLVGVETRGNKIYARIAPWQKPNQFHTLVFTWDDASGWFSMS